MKKKEITDKLVELTADSGKVLRNGSCFGYKITTNVAIVNNWLEVDESEQPSYDIPSFDYNTAVNNKIRERYSESQEFAILRQRDEKPDEYKAYYDYCEECKAKVKAKLVV